MSLPWVPMPVNLLWIVEWLFLSLSLMFSSEKSSVRSLRCSSSLCYGMESSLMPWQETLCDWSAHQANQISMLVYVSRCLYFFFSSPNIALQELKRKYFYTSNIYFLNNWHLVPFFALFELIDRWLGICFTTTYREHFKYLGISLGFLHLVIEVDWSWGWLKLRLIEFEVDWSWGWLKLRLIEVEVDWSWGWLNLRLIEV